ncbi:MAG: RNA methyltransferase, partial [Bacteroidia bacterium]|nr:RNA methyltransferase [Bacteroidia bacterium]
MLSPQELRLFRKFKHRKFRQESNWFVAEGKKLCLDIWKYRPDWIEKIYLHEESEKELKKEFPPAKVCIVQSKELKEITQTMHSQGILALCRKQMKPIPESMRTLSFYLCGIQDPGNVGTIIRTCAWFGITDIFCSSDTADFYHPKVIQASMGAFMYCHLHTINLQDLLNKKIFNTCVRALSLIHI